MGVYSLRVVQAPFECYKTFCVRMFKRMRNRCTPENREKRESLAQRIFPRLRDTNALLQKARPGNLFPEKWRLETRLRVTRVITFSTTQLKYW